MTTKESPDISLGPQANDSTLDEPWNISRPPSGHWYNRQSDFAIESLGTGPGRCLVVGSPIFEALELQDKGWSVWYVDVRRPPDCGLNYVMTADASKEGMGEGIFDAASTTCVLCHAGLGRYGDEVRTGADRRILQNMHRALRPGAKLAVTFGPVYSINSTSRVSRVHRVYTVPDAQKMVSDFRILETRILDIRTNEWVPAINTDRILDINYLSMLLEKP